MLQVHVITPGDVVVSGGIYENFRRGEEFIVRADSYGMYIYGNDGDKCYLQYQQDEFGNIVGFTRGGNA